MVIVTGLVTVEVVKALVLFWKGALEVLTATTGVVTGTEDVLVQPPRQEVIVCVLVVKLVMTTVVPDEVVVRVRGHTVVDV